MTQEEKELLLKDLSARLPYGVKVKRKSKQFGEDIVLVDMYNFSYFLESTDFEHEAIQLYLRPMSSMTEEEYNEYELTFDNVVVYSGHNNNNIHSEHRPTYETFDYLDSIHVDYRDLIPKGLALEAPEDMYK